MGNRKRFIRVRLASGCLIALAVVEPTVSELHHEFGELGEEATFREMQHALPPAQPHGHSDPYEPLQVRASAYGAAGSSMAYNPAIQGLPVRFRF